MSTFVSEPFSLEAGDMIVARVAAQSDKGQGFFSDSNTDGPLLIVPPAIMQAPTLLEKSAEQITVQWTFAGEDYTYELYADYDTGEFE
jgi:hypothetical protein